MHAYVLRHTRGKGRGARGIFILLLRLGLGQCLEYVTNQRRFHAKCIVYIAVYNSLLCDALHLLSIIAVDNRLLDDPEPLLVAVHRHRYSVFIQSLILDVSAGRCTRDLPLFACCARHEMDVIVDVVHL